jgi:hypothetical protein
MGKLVPISRIGKFFGEEDFNLDIEMGMEYLGDDLNMSVVLYRIDRKRTIKDDIYGEAPKDGIVFMPPIEVKGVVQITESTLKQLGNSKVEQKEPGNMKFSFYQKQLDDLNVELLKGDYLGYYVTENKADAILKFDLGTNRREIMDGDMINIPELSKSYRSKIDRNLGFEYNPYVL